MDKNVEEKAAPSDKKGKSKVFVVVVSVVVVLVIAAATYLAFTLLNGKKDTDTDTKDKVVAPVKVMSSLKEANESAKAANDAHADAQAAFDAKQTRLTE